MQKQGDFGDQGLGRITAMVPANERRDWRSMRACITKKIQEKGLQYLQNILFMILIICIAIDWNNILNFIPAWILMLLMDLAKLEDNKSGKVLVDEGKQNLKPLFFDMVFIWVLAVFYLLSLWFHMLVDWWTGLSVIILGFHLGTRYHWHGQGQRDYEALFSSENIQRNNRRLMISLFFIIVGFILAWLLIHMMAFWQIKALSLLFLSLLAVLIGTKTETRICAVTEQKEYQRAWEFWFPTAFIIIAGSFCLMNSYLENF